MAIDAKNLKICRVATADDTSFLASTPAKGSIYFREKTSQLVVGDGSTAGGVMFTAAGADSYVKLSGGTMTGALTFSNSKTIADYLPLSGGTMTGNIVLQNGGFIGQSAGYTHELKLDADGDDSGAIMVLYDGDHSATAGGFLLRAKNSDGNTDFRGGTNGGLSWGGFPLVSFYFTTFTSGSISSSSTSVTVSWSVPSGYTGMPIKCRSNGWVGSPYIGSSNSSSATCYWTHTGSGTVSVDVMFYKRFA